MKSRLLLAIICVMLLIGCCPKTVYDQQYYLDAMGIELDREESK